MDSGIDKEEEAFRRYYVAKTALHEMGVDISSEATIDYQFEELLKKKERGD